MCTSSSARPFGWVFGFRYGGFLRVVLGLLLVFGRFKIVHSINLTKLLNLHTRTINASYSINLLGLVLQSLASFHLTQIQYHISLIVHHILLLVHFLIINRFIDRGRYIDVWIVSIYGDLTWVFKRLIQHIVVSGVVVDAWVVWVITQRSVDQISSSLRVIYVSERVVPWGLINVVIKFQTI